MRMNLSKVKMLQVSKCLIGLAVMMLQSCDVVDNRRDMLCGNWESVEGKPDVLIYKDRKYRLAAFLFPHHGRLPLTGNADGGYLLRENA